MNCRRVVGVLYSPPDECRADITNDITMRFSNWEGKMRRKLTNLTATSDVPIATEDVIVFCSWARVTEDNQDIHRTRRPQQGERFQ